jgi:hypothetical protein
MDKNIKKLWVQPLRSGEFEEGKGYLVRHDRYCALGVLSLLSLLHGQCTYNEEAGIGLFDNKRFSLSYNTMKWAAIAQEGNEFLEPGAGKVKFIYQRKMVSIAGLNDSGMTFPDLAKIIEKLL